MVPILSSIIVGQGARSRAARGFALSLAYSLGMAIVYTALGVAAGLAGEGLAAALQNPWVLGAFAVAAGGAVAVDVRPLRAADAVGAACRFASTRAAPACRPSWPACSRWAGCRR